jgi:ATP synthase protein I
MRQLDRRHIGRLLLIQLIASMLVATVAWLFRADAGMSALIGGLASLTGNLLFAVWVFAPYRAQQPGGLLSRFYLAELAKLIMIGLVFAAAIVWLKPLNVVALFGAFFVVQVLSPLLAHSMAE